MALKHDLVRTAGSLSRVLHDQGVIRGTASGAVRFAAGKVAAQGTYVYRDRHGHLVEADLADYMERIGFFGAHSSHLVRFITSQLRPGDWAIDAGANVGLISSPMAAAVGPVGSVWACEPLPRNVARLRALKSTNELGQLEVFPVALSSTTSTARLRLSTRPGGSGAASFVAPWARREHVEVPTRTLDDVVVAGSLHQPLRLLKIDVEGSELELVRGAETTLRTRRPLVVCEFHDVLLRAAGTSSEELLATFADYGYVPEQPFARPPGPLDHKVVDMLLVPSRRSVS